MSDTVIIAGRGRSVEGHAFNAAVPVMAIGSAVCHVPTCQHLVALDDPDCFPDWVRASDAFYKHTPTGLWNGQPKVIEWEYDDAVLPSFEEGPIAAGPRLFRTMDTLPAEVQAIVKRMDRPHVVAYRCKLNSSLFFAVQLAPRLGYTRCEFIGVDLRDESDEPALDALGRPWEQYEAKGTCAVMRTWYSRAMAAGIEWINMSPDSRLAEFMPTEVPV